MSTGASEDLGRMKHHKNNTMTGIITNLSIITLNVNDLHYSTEDADRQSQ
jgi:hypothetical protein